MSAYKSKVSSRKQRKVIYSSSFEPAEDMIDSFIKLTEDDITKVMDRAYTKGMKIPIQTITEWFEYVHHKTGATFESWHDPVTKRRGTWIEYIYGYDKKNGGLNVIFFEYGTPRIKPEFVMYYSIKNNESLFLDVAEEEVYKAFKELMV